jgi:hypothetical protein
MSVANMPAAAESRRQTARLPLPARWALALGVPLIAGLQLLHWLRWAPQKLAMHALLLDDAFFYSVLARNYDRFGVLTLDGEMPTNGVQPLWMGLQILLVKLAPGLHEVSLLGYASWVGYLICAFLCVRFLQGLDAGAAGRRVGIVWGVLFLGGLLLINVRFQALAVQGLETPLCLALVALFLLALRGALLARRGAPGEAARPVPRRWVIALALIGTLCFFARTDLFWIPLTGGLWLATRRRARRIDLLLYGMLVAVLVVPYLASNYATQGGLMPISGRVKLFYSRSFYDTWSAYWASTEWTALLHAFADPFPLPAAAVLPWTAVLLLGAYAVVFFAWRPRRRRAATESATSAAAGEAALRLLGLALLGHLLFLHLWYRVLEPRSAYYFAPELLWVGLVLAAGLTRLARSPAHTAWSWRRLLPPLAAGLAILTAAAAWGGRAWAPDRYWTRRLDLADDIREIAPPGVRVAAFWPGCFAQFSGRLVTPLDGVIGSNAYFQEYVVPGRELDYMLEREIPLLATLLPMWPDSSTTPARWRTWFHQDLPHWTRLGVQRLYERDHELLTRLLSARVVGKEQGGWCLLAVVPRPDSLSQEETQHGDLERPDP